MKIYNHDIPVQYLRIETQLATLINDDSFLRDLLTTGGPCYLWKDLQLQLF